jgi:GH25 family lysozyme M1 (1,4-beta-N-acetylmuramidase)
MISRAFGLPWKREAEAQTEEDLSPWAAGHVAALRAEGYLAGVEDRGAKTPFTRADVITVLNNIISHRGWESAGRMVVNGALIPYGDYHFYPGDFKTENGRVYYTGTAARAAYGIDVSAHQKEIDWQAVAEDGAQFAMIRLGYRGYTVGNLNEDAWFRRNIEGALAAGLEVGVYFFSQAVSAEEAQEEARFTLELLEPYRDRITLPVVYDWEDIGTKDARTYKLDRNILDACALAFCGEIERAGYDPMIYFYQYLGEERYHLDATDQYPFWYCHYKTPWPNLERPFQMWQYTSSGKINGVEGNVDWNICFY